MFLILNIVYSMIYMLHSERNCVWIIKCTVSGSYASNCLIGVSNRNLFLRRNFYNICCSEISDYTMRVVDVYVSHTICCCWLQPRCRLWWSMQPSKQTPIWRGMLPQSPVWYVTPPKTASTNRRSYTWPWKSSSKWQYQEFFFLLLIIYLTTTFLSSIFWSSHL